MGLIEGARRPDAVQTVFGLGPCGVDRPAEVADLLARAGFSCSADGDSCLRVSAAGRDDAARLNQLVVEAGFSVHSLSCEGVSLESIFLDLTFPLFLSLEAALP